jgi:glutaredoxin
VRLLLIIALAFAPNSIKDATRSAVEQGSAQVTVYDATWCSACKSLEAALRSRGIPFDTVDVDQNPGAFAIAKKATGTNAIPLTNIIRGPLQSWVVGANPDAVERAYNGE